MLILKHGVRVEVETKYSLFCILSGCAPQNPYLDPISALVFGLQPKADAPLAQKNPYLISFTPILRMCPYTIIFELKSQ